MRSAFLAVLVLAAATSAAHGRRPVAPPAPAPVLASLAGVRCVVETTVTSCTMSTAEYDLRSIRMELDVVAGPVETIRTAEGTTSAWTVDDACSAAWLRRVDLVRIETVRTPTTSTIRLVGTAKPATAEIASR